MDRGFPRRSFFAALTAWVGPLAPWRLSGGERSEQAEECVGAPDLRDQARESLLRGVTFFVREVASYGGYVYRYSDDLTKREGEGKVGMETVWVQPPGTPSVGEAMLLAYERTGEAVCLEGARACAECLFAGQYVSGGWGASIEFGAAERRKHAYRVEGAKGKSKKQRNLSTLDDDKSQSALRFLMKLDRALEFRDTRLGEAVRYGLRSLLSAQHANGGWAQVWDGAVGANGVKDLRATVPDSWPREYPGGEYWWHYTFNDGNISRVLETLWLADAIYGELGFRDAILRCGEFVLLAQLPDPQPAWAQQYNRQMQPAWGRKFEPPAVSGGESQSVVQTVLDLYVATGDSRYLRSAERAIAYLESSKLPDGRLARFYELGTNRPLYMTKDYRLTYESDDLPSHYGFVVECRVERLRTRWNQLKSQTELERRAEFDRVRWGAKPGRRESEAVMSTRVRAVIAEQDARGAWVEDGRMRYFGVEDRTQRVIESATWIRNVGWLSEYLSEAGVDRER